MRSTTPPSPDELSEKSKLQELKLPALPIAGAEDSNKKNKLATLANKVAQLAKSVAIFSEAEFAPEHSVISAPTYVFNYTITISNHGVHSIQLLQRQWAITNGRGEQIIVEGQGVVGMNPTIAAGQSFCYSSVAEISTPRGSMEGRYLFVDLKSSTEFWVDIPAFVLYAPVHKKDLYLN
ncbi:MAG: Co2+/Mg2+ efflux protein ApaG [Oligoflexales bacterium]|nr:Co2+/Mg2+ efflux protein ApaG [Oligoflexales bacterium]